METSDASDDGHGHGSLVGVRGDHLSNEPRKGAVAAYSRLSNIPEIFPSDPVGDRKPSRGGNQQRYEVLVMLVGTDCSHKRYPLKGQLTRWSAVSS